MKQTKVLHVVRHAKSSWDFDGTADIDRTLKEKGIRNAYAVSRKMKLSNLLPEKILSSPANRALHTAVIFARVFEYPLSKLEIIQTLYESSSGSITDMLRALDDRIGSVMIFGHNPDFTELVNTFIKSPIENLPTSGAATMEFDAARWKDISRSNLIKEVLIFPGIDE
jgi:phosphohistidine phosphatase